MNSTALDKTLDGITSLLQYRVEIAPTLTEDVEPAQQKDFSQPPKWFHDGQLEAWNSRALDTIACAGTQGGKTAIQAPWLLREIQRCAPLIYKLGKGKFIYAGPTLTLLQEQALGAFEDLFAGDEQLGRLLHGQKARFFFSQAGLHKVLGFVTASVSVTFAYTKDSSNIESMTALGGAWDEAGQKENKEAAYKAYNRRLKVARSTTFGEIYQWCKKQGLSDAPWFKFWKTHYYDIEGPKARFGRRMWSTTPYEWNWFKTAVADRAEKAKENGKTHDLNIFHFDSWMNPLVSKEECEKEQETMPDWEWQMMYRGLYTKPAGLVFDCFSDDVVTGNLCVPFTIPDHWPRYIGADFGGINTAAVFLAEDPESGGEGVPKTLFQYAEYHPGKNLEWEEHAAGMKRAAGCTPTGAGGSHQEEGWREAYRKNGIPLSEPPNVGVEVQYQCVYGEIKTRRLKVFNTCAKTIKQYHFFSYVLDDDGKATDQYNEEKKYHMLASKRYIVSTIRPSRHDRHASALEALKRLTPS